MATNGRKGGTQSMTVRQVFILRLVIRGNGETTTTDLRLALAERGIVLTSIGNLSNLKGLERNGWIKPKKKAGRIGAEADDKRPVNAWTITKEGKAVYDQAVALLAPPTKSKAA